jgi:hypothetical protein
MGIELKTLIEDTCRQFGRNFSAGDLARLVPRPLHRRRRGCRHSLPAPLRGAANRPRLLYAAEDARCIRSNRDSSSSAGDEIPPIGAPPFWSATVMAATSLREFGFRSPAGHDRSICRRADRPHVIKQAGDGGPLEARLV